MKEKTPKEKLFDTLREFYRGEITIEETVGIIESLK